MAGIRFLFNSPLIGGNALLGALLTMASAVRVLYPALAGGADNGGGIPRPVCGHPAWRSDRGVNQRTAGATSASGLVMLCCSVGRLSLLAIQPDAALGIGAEVFLALFAG